MITALPEGLEPMVDTVAAAIMTDTVSDGSPWMGAEHLGKIDPYYRSVLRDGARVAILAFLNAALDAGVADEEQAMRSVTEGMVIYPNFLDAPCRVLIIRTGP